jgi:membrane protein DedA with SNARE-associated domain
MNIFIIILVGVVGSVLGAIINYFLSMSLGRFLVYKLAEHKLAKLIFINPEKIARAEKYFLENSKSATFFGRLIPVIRQFVSIPAGFCRMNFAHFILLTAAGSAIWVTILAALGFFIGSKKEMLEMYYKELSYGLLFFGFLYILFKIRRYRHKKLGR